MFQKCPICKGEGNINQGNDVYAICPTCNGTRILSQLTGLPPNRTIEPDVSMPVEGRISLNHKESLEDITRMQKSIIRKIKDASGRINTPAVEIEHLHKLYKFIVEQKEKAEIKCSLDLEAEKISNLNLSDNPIIHFTEVDPS